MVHSSPLGGKNTLTNYNADVMPEGEPPIGHIQYIVGMFGLTTACRFSSTATGVEIVKQMQEAQ